MISVEDVLQRNSGILGVQLYAKEKVKDIEHDVKQLLLRVKSDEKEINTSLEILFEKLKAIGIEA